MILLFALIPFVVLFVGAFLFDARQRRRTGSALKVEGLLKKPSFAEAMFEGSPEGVIYDQKVRDRDRGGNYGDLGRK
jgi:hypothetical protein